VPLTPGTRLGPYEIVGAIGQGGMGDVYKARDTRLGRIAAIKVLPDRLAGDPERLARFEREARTLAALNHANIAQIYGMEDGAVAMEYVEGIDLSAVIARGRVPIDEALAIARQIADGLEAAHEIGVVHRDLKPSNIRIREDGTVKLLDFGLAKALSPASSIGELSAPTVTSPALTDLGVILGTAAYMAPEQGKGKPVDRRADIWAFGVPKQRLRDIGDWVRELEDPRAPPGANRRATLAWSVAGVMGAAAVALALLYFNAAERIEVAPVVRFAVDPPPNAAFDSSLSASPDGRLLAFVARESSGRTRIWPRHLERHLRRDRTGRGVRAAVRGIGRRITTRQRHSGVARWRQPGQVVQQLERAVLPGA
jgi:serine/threonine protein kinase